MRKRPSSRLLVLDRNSRVLLFRFVFKRGSLADQAYWATPGGAVETDETFAQAARRELFEETGIVIDTVDEPIAEKEFALQLPDGEHVMAEERYFLVRTVDQALSRDHWTSWESEVMVDHRWWSVNDLTTTNEMVFPENLVEILAAIEARTEK